MVTVDRAEAGGWGRLPRFAVHARLSILVRFALLALLATCWVRPASAERLRKAPAPPDAAVAPRTDGPDRNEVYRIVVQQGIPEREAQDFKLHMEGLGYVPVILGDFTEDGRATVFYGNFANKAEAERAKADLRRSSIPTVAVVSVKPSRNEPVGGGNFYTIVVDSFRQRSEAEALVKKLGEAGQIGVKVVSQANVYYVTIGKYSSRDTAGNVVASLKNEGHDKAAAVEMTSEGALRVAPPAAAAGGDELDIRKIVGELGANLSEKQKEEVARLIEEKVKLAIAGASGDPAAVERLQRLEEQLLEYSGTPQVLDVVKEVDAELTRRLGETCFRGTEIGVLMRDAETLANAEKFDDAMAKIDLILKLDPNNQLAIVRKEAFENLKTGCYASVHDQGPAYMRLKAEAVALVAQGDRTSLLRAKTIWITIKGLDASYETEADAAIASINAQQRIGYPEPRSGVGLSLAVGIAGAFLSSGVLLGAVLLRRRRRAHAKTLHPISPPDSAPEGAPESGANPTPN